MSKHFKTMHDINEALKTAGTTHGELILEAIEALKRWIYRRDYQGPEKEPSPATEDEFARLMNGLRRWATLHAPYTDTGRLQDYRRAELSLPSPCGAPREFPDELAERAWWQIAFRADDALNELKILLYERSQQKASKRRMSREEANEKGKELAKQLGPAFFQLSGREQARQIGCSWKTWERTELYQSAKKRGTLAPKNQSGGRPAVSFTPALESVTGQGERDEVLEQLIAEQTADDEPSPLDARRKKVRSRKRL